MSSASDAAATGTGDRPEPAAHGTVPAPRVLIIAGSPRRRGNSATLARECAAGVREAGGETVEMTVVDYSIAPCSGCHTCSSSGVCTVKDGMRTVYEQLDAADAIAVASPVYFATVPATLKALYDRCQPYWVRRYVLNLPRPPRRPAALLLVRGGGDPFGFDAAVATSKSVFAVLDLDYHEEMQLTGPDEPGDVAAMPDALVNARQVGRSLVDEVRRRSAPAGS